MASLGKDYRIIYIHTYTTTIGLSANDDIQTTSCYDCDIIPACDFMYASALCSCGFSTDRLTGHGESVRNTNKPQVVSALSGHFIEDIAVGSEHTLAVSSTGDVFSWGNNVDGQLGLGNTTTARTPQLITSLSGKNIRRVRACHGY